MSTTKRHSNAVDMVRDIFGSENEQIAEELKQQIEHRQLVRLLATMRNKFNVTQEDVAHHLGCNQSRISKIENGTDDSVSMAEVEAYAKATNCDIELTFRRRNMTLVDEIKYHAHCIRRCFDKLNSLASNDESMSRGLSNFCVEAFYNFTRIVASAAQQLQENIAKDESTPCSSHLHIRRMVEDCLHSDDRKHGEEVNEGEAVLR